MKGIYILDISKEIKKLLIDSDITLTELARKKKNNKNKHYTVQNLSQKLKNGTVNAKEIAIILDCIGYSVYFVPKK